MTFAFGRTSGQRSTRYAFAALCVALLLGACGETVEVGFDNELVTGGGGGGTGASGGMSGGGAGGLQIGGSIAAGGSGAMPTGGQPGCTPITCRGKPYKCGNCMDDDGDGKIDAFDPDCLGPCDDDEAGLSTGLTAMTTGGGCRLDCYFDGDAGPGNDKCNWDHICDPKSVAPNYPPSGDPRCAYNPNATSMGESCQSLSAMQDQQCLDNCLPLVPNGCDCFGCCLLPDGNYHYVGHGKGAAGCQLDHLDDAVACPPCTHVESCYNDCAPCETCVGKLPDPSCAPSGGCKAGQRTCDETSPCDVGDYCVTGCCVRAPPPT